jgi:hypothetical protein
MRILLFLIAWFVVAFFLGSAVGKFIKAGSGENGDSSSVSNEE